MQETRIVETVIRSIGEMKIAGTASVVWDGTPGTETHLMGQVYERVAPGAWTDVLKRGDDIIFTFGHNTAALLGRSASGTGRAFENASGGLDYEITLPNTQVGRDVWTLVERGDLKGSSFVAEVGFKQWSKDGDKEVRTIKRWSKLFELGPVVMPAYGATGVAIRSAEISEIEKEREHYLAMIDTQMRIEKAKRWDRYK